MDGSVRRRKNDCVLSVLREEDGQLVLAGIERAAVAQLVERVLGKDEVTSSSLVSSFENGSFENGLAAVAGRLFFGLVQARCISQFFR